MKSAKRAFPRVVMCLIILLPSTMVFLPESSHFSVLFFFLLKEKLLSTSFIYYQESGIAIIVVIRTHRRGIFPGTLRISTRVCVVQFCFLYHLFPFQFIVLLLSLQIELGKDLNVMLF